MAAAHIDSLICTIYDAVIAADGFQQFVDRLKDAFQLKAAMLFTQNVLNGEAKSMWQHGFERRWLESYAIEYGSEDQLAHLMRTSNMANFYASNVHLATDEHTTSRFYREWIVPQGVGCAAGAVIMREGVWATQVVLQRSVSQPPFTTAELALLEQLVPHLRRAVQMRHRFIELQMNQTLLTAGLDVVAMPSIMLDEWGGVVYANTAARLLIDARNGLWIEDRNLCTDNLTLTKQINVEVIMAVGASRGSTNTVPGVIRIPRPHQPPLTLTIVPMRATDAELKGAAIAFVFDPANTPGTAPSLVEQLFSLTNAEAELVVALCGGNTLEEAAQSRRTSLHTVRTQLKSIFVKTGTHRQADLITLVLSSPAYFVARH